MENPDIIVEVPKLDLSNPSTEKYVKCVIWDFSESKWADTEIDNTKTTICQYNYICHAKKFGVFAVIYDSYAVKK